jgi:hypothetical protein
MIRVVSRASLSIRIPFIPLNTKRLGYREFVFVKLLVLGDDVHAGEDRHNILVPLDAIRNVHVACTGNRPYNVDVGDRHFVGHAPLCDSQCKGQCVLIWIGDAPIIQELRAILGGVMLEVALLPN